MKGHEVLMTEEIKQKISIATKGKKRSPSGCVNIGLAKKGRKLSNEHKEKIRLSHLGKKIPKLQGRISPLKGIPRSLETKYKISINRKGKMTGDSNPNWIKDRTKLAKRQERNDTAYKEWRMNVWKRDNFKCKMENDDCDGSIIAHHILPWRDYVELRYNINNGITLCHFHHPRKRIEEANLSLYFKKLVENSN